MPLDHSEITAFIRAKLEGLPELTESYQKGTVISIKDGIATVYGLQKVMLGELLEFPNQVSGLALNLERHAVGVVILGNAGGVVEGDEVICTGRILEVPVGRSLVGRVVSALGEPIDGKGTIETDEVSPIEKIAPGVIWRQSVCEPLQTGYKSIDSMIPIGRGQRELIIGDRQVGKTTLALDTIIRQKDTGVTCIYVAIGQKSASISSLVRTLTEYDAMKHTIVVAASASESAALQYIAPYAGCAMGEYFRDHGEDALIVYDDLSKQAVAYRQISLLLRRPPGREAYPGDVFYLHSRLLERSARVSAAYVEKVTQGKVKGKTGSLTALPIVETQAGDISAFVPTNIISITDGQIFLSADLFCSGIRPAVDVGISVSRVGGAAQKPIIKKLAGGVKLALAQYRELAAFSQFASDLDEATRKQLVQGQTVTELMKQKHLMTLSIADIALTLWSINQGYYEGIAIDQALSFEAGFRRYIEDQHPSLLQEVEQTGEVFSQQQERLLKSAMISFKAHFESTLSLKSC